ncbi:MAG: MFS transporter, partial [Altererythrobacter ishigakiensis]|nr:MFS transporter [Altererythrobacter ishigakiensis]
EKSFIALFFAMIFASISTGIATSLSFIMLNYFWAFSEFQIFIWTATVFFSAFLGFLIAPRVTRRFGKKEASIGLGVLAFSIAPTPVILRLLGLMPENGAPILFPLVLSINVIDLALIIAVQAVIYSMIADLVESNQLKTGRRSEGVYYASITFTRKTTQGLGVLSGGLILSAVAFPQGAAPDTVSPDTLWWLGAFYAPSLVIMWSVMLYCISRYRIDRNAHEENLRKLQQSAQT